jgi:hypothetical protein
MADNPYDLSGLYGDTPAASPSPQKKKADAYDLSGLYVESTPAPVVKQAAPQPKPQPESIGQKILNAPGVGSTLSFHQRLRGPAVREGSASWI